MLEWIYWELLKINRNKKLIMKVFSKIAYYFNLLLAVNIPATLRINFKLLRWRDAIKLPIIIFGKIKITSLSGKVTFNIPIKKGLVKIGVKKEMVTTTFGVAQLHLAGTLVVNGRFEIATDVRLIIQDEGTFIVGQNTYIGCNTKLIVTNPVEFGRYVRFAYDSQLISTNSHFLADMKTLTAKRLSRKGIVIGDNCWIGNGSNIMNGTVLPPCTIVASHSLVNKDMSSLTDYPMIGGMPAKLIKNGICRIYNESTERVIYDYFKAHPEVDTFDITGYNIL